MENRKAFTLLELIIVAVVMALIISMIVFGRKPAVERRWTVTTPTATYKHVRSLTYPSAQATSIDFTTEDGQSVHVAGTMTVVEEPSTDQQKGAGQ